MFTINDCFKVTLELYVNAVIFIVLLLKFIEMQHFYFLVYLFGRSLKYFPMMEVVFFLFSCIKQNIQFLKMETKKSSQLFCI